MLETNMEISVYIYMLTDLISGGKMNSKWKVTISIITLLFFLFMNHSAFCRGHDLYPWMTFYGQEEGLSDNEVTALLPHGEKLMIGTARAGLFSIAPSGNPELIIESESIPGRRINQLGVAGDDLLVLTNSGALICPSGQGERRIIASGRGVQCSQMFRGKLYLGTDSGIMVYDDKLQEIESLKMAAGKRFGRVTSMAVYDGLLYAGTGSKGCFIFDPETEQWDIFNRDNGMMSLSVRCLQSSERYFMIGNTRGFEIYDRVTRNWLRHTKGVAGTGIPVRLASEMVNVIMVDGGTAWFGTEEGLTNYVLDVSGDYKDFVGEAPPENAFMMPKKCPCRLRWNNIGKRTGMSSDAVSSLALFAGDLWVGTKDGGLNRIAGFYVSGDGWNELYKIVNLVGKINKSRE
ncbi:MAG: hypothetical protein CVV64_05905 [Candidatus Wallbacteria bacterium HGW-Wallbacteria-1]|uniref:Uncharacterized protein n=1 Tax=Candidatus Wallbacteria bacterium HGW-Wallbacteria-1 TaxID=2013854 RepID=A0A2N1PSJ1_9BACT|nr:MAG: hypothetical protein CVV64_05905 [Candidatus Wallbacteria bacterium HGW-Wallbacteria-1]